jgi:hypothetical protein
MGREALIRGIERKILFVIVDAYPGNDPPVLKKKELFVGRTFRG